MRALTSPDDRQDRRFAMLAWGWAMLLVVLLSAAPTGGAPRSAVVGSAFDPASVSVVIGPKRSELRAEAKAIHKRPGESHPQWTGLVRASLWPPLTRISAGPAMPESRSPPLIVMMASPARGPHAARAPPAA